MKSLKAVNWSAIAVLALVPACVATSTVAPDSTLIPRSAIFGNPERAAGQISPDGKYVSFLAPRDGVMNVWVVERGKALAQARPLTNERVRPIRIYSWAANGEDIVFAQDKGGDENFLLYAVNVEKGVERTLTDFKGVRVLTYGASLKRPDEIVVGINERDKAFHDPYLLNVRTGAIRKLFDNTEKYASFLVDDDLSIRFVTRATPDGGWQFFKYENGNATLLETVGFEDSNTTAPRGLTRDGKTLYWMESRGRNTAALMAIDLATGKKTVDPRSHDGRGLGLWGELPEERVAGCGSVDERRHRFPQRKSQGAVGRDEPDALQQDLAGR